jgi:diguanylate cyclase (GGDEF)-like protein
MSQVSLDIATTSKTTELPAQIVAASLSLLALAIVTAVDQQTGAKTSVLPLYLVPVVIATWLGGRPVGVSITLLCGVAWYVAQLLTDPPAFEGWELFQNAFMRTVVFGAVCFLVLKLVSLRKMSDDQARFDPLTGLGNRAAFFYRATIALGQASVRAAPVSLVIIDIKALHSINTRLGQQRGDLVISLSANAARAIKRRGDVIARTSGDEIVLFMPQTDDATARSICDSLRLSLDRVSGLAGCDVRHSLVLVTASRAPLAIEDMLNVGEGELRMADGFREIQFTEAARGGT